MDTFFRSYDAALGVIRGGFFGVALVLGGVCVVDWLVRSRRLNPFGPVARFMRGTFDPLIAPVERRVVRAGGLPQAAPWWALVFVVLAGIVLISLLEFVRNQLAFLLYSMESGPRGAYRVLVSWTFAILQLALIARVILSWVRVRPGHWIVRWSYNLSEPLLRPLRRIIPTIGMIDVTPIIAYLFLNILQSFLLRLW
ncbi:MAG: YggT family protein [Gemmatimonadetes bacterium]|nr:YggT family protein [Gemmatimonadota bacterium]